MLIEYQKLLELARFLWNQWHIADLEIYNERGYSAYERMQEMEEARIELGIPEPLPNYKHKE